MNNVIWKLKKKVQCVKGEDDENVVGFIFLKGFEVTEGERC